MRYPSPANIRRSKALTGRPKSQEMRAALAASRMVDKKAEPVLWQFVYEQKLQKIQEREHLLSLVGELN